MRLAEDGSSLVASQVQKTTQPQLVWMRQMDVEILSSSGGGKM
jgi:hypothetical protein